MTAIMEKKQLSNEWPRYVFHSDGVRNTQATSHEHYERLMKERCWHDDVQPPPPPPPEPMTQEEQMAMTASLVEGLGAQFDAMNEVVGTIEQRLNALENDSHAPVDYQTPLTEMEGRVLKLEQSRQGASGVTGAFQDRLNNTDALLADVRRSMDAAASTLARIMERIDALETKKSPKG